MNIRSNSTADRVAGRRRIRTEVPIAVVWAILSLASRWSGSAQTNVSLELREALDDTNLVWRTSEPLAWALQLAETHDGTDAAEGGPLQAGIVAVLTSISSRVIGPGRLSFWWKLEDAECFKMSLLVGSNELATIGPSTMGSTNWASQTVAIPSGPQDLTWVFNTMCGDGSPPGRAWLDEVQYLPDRPALGVPRETGEGLAFEVTGSSGTRVQAEISTNLLAWTPIPSAQVTLDNGRGVLQVPKPDSNAFYRTVTVPSGQ